MKKYTVVYDTRFALPQGIKDAMVPIREADFMLVFGGDGTILKAFRMMANFGRLDMPLFGINKGTVGFMANEPATKDLHPDTVGDFYGWYVNAIMGNNTMVAKNLEERPLLDVTVNGHEFKVLNEVTIHPKSLGKLLTVEMEIQTIKADDGRVIELKGDGVVVATPTGSTAYNLSAGGPIIMPHMEAMVVTPLNPFTMSARSIVMGQYETVTLFPEHTAKVVVDGRVIEDADEIKVEVSEDKLLLVRTSSFFSAIQDKLGWNRSIK